MNLHETKVPPKRFAARFDIDSRTVPEPLPEILEWIKTTLSGDVYWVSTRFRDKNSGCHAPVRKKHFTDGYCTHTFWLTKEVDALHFKLRWTII